VKPWTPPPPEFAASRTFAEEPDVPPLEPTVTVVCPAYQEEAVLPAFHARLAAVLDRLGADYTVEVLYVDDGSTDGTLEVLRRLASADARVRYLSLSRNFGHQAALTAGLEHAAGEVVVSMDSDLQHPPEVIPTLLARWRQGYDIVVTERHDAVDTGMFKKVSSRGFYWLLSRLSDTPVRPAASDFRLLSRPALAALLRLRESHRFLRGMVDWLGFRVATVPFQAAPRAAGQSRYTLRRMLRLAADGLLSFSRVPLRLPLYAGAASLALGMAQAVTLAVLALMGREVAWLLHAVLLAVLLVGGCLLIGEGMLGEYLARVFEQVKQRPLYLVKESSPGVGNAEVGSGMRAA
jgi:dolichol-phosphate mannosyltransferase